MGYKPRALEFWVMYNALILSLYATPKFGTIIFRVTVASAGILKDIYSMHL